MKQKFKWNASVSVKSLNQHSSASKVQHTNLQIVFALNRNAAPERAHRAAERKINENEGAVRSWPCGMRLRWIGIVRDSRQPNNRSLKWKIKTKCIPETTTAQYICNGNVLFIFSLLHSASPIHSQRMLIIATEIAGVWLRFLSFPTQSDLFSLRWQNHVQCVPESQRSTSLSFAGKLIFFFKCDLCWVTHWRLWCVLNKNALQLGNGNEAF